ncbi:MAG TPA: pitrilysin family protein [Thermoanaerobaculia bacterium]|jgi:zinc protease|nr:pitrilysin family protein [Thermoanaerobaculia bacterium]
MKRTATLLATLFVAASAFSQVTDYREIKPTPLRKFAMPQPKRIQLANGMVIFLQEDHELPLVRGRALIRGGARNVPAAKSGLMGIYSGAWRTGGTAKQSGDELDQFLESRAAFVETGADTDSTSVSMNVLEGDFDTVFPIWNELLRNPAFRQEKIDLAKTQSNTAISRRNDEPGGIIGREAAKLGYGTDSPYARQSEYATIASITREDLLDFHKRTVHPNNIILSFIGDFDSAKLEKKLRDTFSSWTRGPQVAKPDPTANPAKPGVYFIAKDDVTQANIAMVHAGTQRDNPDYPALVVMNEIFGGGFSGRLLQTLRSQRGLTYGVGGGVSAPWDYRGLFRVQMATKSETTLEAIDALRGEIRRLVNDPVTDAELSLAKESILNAYVFTMDTREKALGQRVLLEYYGFPADYFEKYPTLLGKVTTADVQRVAQKYVHPDSLAVLVVGKESAFEKPLSTLGPVTTIDITIPSAEPKAAAAPGAGNAEGKALAQKVAQFVGNVSAIQALGRTGTMLMVTPQGEMQADVHSVTRYPDAQRVVMKMSMGEVTRVVSPEASFMITPMGTQDMPSSQRDSSLADLRSELVAVLKNLDNPKYTFMAGAMEGDARVLEINADGNAVKWHVDPATGRVLRTMSREMVSELGEWKSFGGLNLPTMTVLTRNGEKAGEVRVANVEVNPAIDAKAFVKP